MASAVVDEALQCLDLVPKGYGALDDVKIGLKHMRTFLLFASKWHNEVRSKSDENTTSSSLMMGSFLNKLEDSLIENGKNFHNPCLAQENTIRCSSLFDLFESGLFDSALKLGECIDSFRKEIAESYITLSDYYRLQSRDLSLEFFDSLQVNMADIRHGCSDEKDNIDVEPLQEKLLFFKNFIRFAQLRGFKPWQLQRLFTYLQVVAVNAARLCYEWTFLPYSGKTLLRDEFQFKFSELLLKINPVDPQIREIYVQVLMASKLSMSSHALTLGTDRHVLRDFVDSLLYNILEALTKRDNYIVSLKDQVPMLYEGLIFLNTILTNHLEKIDELHEKVKDFIGAAINEAAIVICSLPVHELEEGLAKEMDFALLSFLEKIKLIKVITSSFIFPRTNEHGFVDFFLENLKELQSCKADLIAYTKDQIQTVQEDLTLLRSSFLESDLDQRNQDGKLQSLWSRVAEVAYKTRFVIESLVVRDILDCSALEFNRIKSEINLIKMEALRIENNQCSLEAQNAAKTSGPSSSQGSTPTISKMEVTLDDETNAIIEQLTRGSKQLEIISIVGMPGIGKTNLAKNVYDDPRVIDFFRARAWCVVSQTYQKKNLLIQILASVDCDFSDDNYSRKNEYELEEMLKKCLLRKRYFVVLDDVWDVDAWSDLARAFPDDTNSSRILLTSRHSDVAKKINSSREPHPLRLLTNEESWHLLQKKLSSIKSYPLNLGEKIAKNCKGLPLTIIIVAGILAHIEQDSWVEFAERLSLSDLPIIDQCMDMLEVSYKTLPEYLRSCLLYFGVLLEDTEIPCKRLIWLWNAEGFVQKCETRSIEDVARDYIDDLIGRSLVMVSKKRSIGGVKTCHIHDLLREFCMVKAKKEKFLFVLSGHDELFNSHGQRDLQRLSIHSTSKYFEKSTLFCPSVRSLLFVDNVSFKHRHLSFIFHFFKFLKVLSLANINLGSTFPSEIALLVELRHLAIQGDHISIPPVVANLSDLETLVVYAKRVFLPDTLWNLSKLRALWSNGGIFLNSGLMSANLDNLDTLSTVVASYRQLEEIMRKLPNVRILKCRLLEEESEESNADCKSVVVKDWLNRMESLRLDQDAVGMQRIGFRFPLNIKKLSFSHCHSSIIPKGGELHNLVVLKLDYIHFQGLIWYMDEEWEFPQLKFLVMKNSKILRWTGSDGVDHFPRLEKLVVESCNRLKEVPSCLGNVSNLQMIEVSHCGDFTASLFQKIKEEQSDWGNEIQLIVENVDDVASELEWLDWENNVELLTENVENESGEDEEEGWRNDIEMLVEHLPFENREKEA